MPSLHGSNNRKRACAMFPASILPLRVSFINVLAILLPWQHSFPHKLLVVMTKPLKAFATCRHGEAAGVGALWDKKLDISLINLFTTKKMHHKLYLMCKHFLNLIEGLGQQNVVFEGLTAWQAFIMARFGNFVSKSRSLGIGRRSLMAFCMAFFPIHRCPRIFKKKSQSWLYSWEHLILSYLAMTL